MDNDERAGQSTTQFAIDALALALLAGAANGLVLSAVRAGILGVIVGPAVGAFVGLVVWVPAVVVTRYLTVRQRAGRSRTDGFRWSMIGVGAFFGALPAIASAVLARWA